jgi:hypothetical protein
VNRAQLEHVIRAAATIADDDEIVVIGSQSVLGQFPTAPDELCVSNEADVYPRKHPERWALIDGSIGELSPFHDTFGYYGQGVEPGTAVLPEKWEDRLVLICGPGTRGAKGLCLEIHDLVVSKAVACREKDHRFIRAAARAGLVDRAEVSRRVATTRIAPEIRESVLQLLKFDLMEVRHG